MEIDLGPIATAVLGFGARRAAAPSQAAGDEEARLAALIEASDEDALFRDFAPLCEPGLRCVRRSDAATLANFRGLAQVEPL